MCLFVTKEHTKINNPCCKTPSLLDGCLPVSALRVVKYTVCVCACACMCECVCVWGGGGVHATHLTALCEQHAQLY